MRVYIHRRQEARLFDTDEEGNEVCTEARLIITDEAGNEVCTEAVRHQQNMGGVSWSPSR